MRRYGENNRMGIEDKVAVVTGAASGIGRGAAIVFAREGAKVVVTDGVNMEGGNETVRLIREAGGEATFVKCDVSSESDVESMVAKTVELYGSLDFAYNNAGVGPDGVTIPFSHLTDLAEADWDAVVDTNLKGVFLCMKHELRRMREQCSGVIVNTSSTGGFRMMPGFGAYGPSKAAVMSLTRLAAAENKDKGIRVNVVAPGPTKGTGMMNRLLSCTPDDQGPPRHLMGTPEDIARVVVWLCSDEAAFVTGNTVSVDGGLDVS